MSDTVRLIGPYLGLLKNGGESVRLQAPTAPPVGEPGPVYYLVDRVTYDDQSPWPTSADGTGDSLSRVTAEAFGDESTNWLASLPTPGSVSFLPAHPADFDGNGQVDGNDFLTWQTGFGQFRAAAPPSDGDADRDGDVDGNDFLLWQSGFGGGQAMGGGSLVASTPAADARRVLNRPDASSRGAGFRSHHAPHDVAGVWGQRMGVGKAARVPATSLGE